MDYKNKYIKYKYKYNLLKKYIGGASENKITQEVFEQSLVALIIQKLNELISVNPILSFITINDNKVSIDNGKWTWDAIKNKDDKILKLLFDFRKSLVDSLLEKIKTHFNCNGNECHVEPSGSVGDTANLKSDYDLTLVMKGFSTSKAIQIFNSVIYKVFDDAPFMVFDTNLYGYSPMIPKKSGLIISNTKLWDKNEKILYYCLLYGKNKDQDNWALRRLYTFMNNDMNKDMKAIIDCDIAKKFCVANPLVNMELKYLGIMTEFETKCKDKDVTDCNKTDKKNDLMNTLSNMNYYGDETYFSVGAFLHVVGTMFYLGGQQEDIKRIICQPPQLIHSMIENLAYFIHSYVKTDDIIIAIKYMARFMDAYLQYTKYKSMNNASMQSTPIEEELITLMNDIKNHVRNASDTSINTYYSKGNYPPVKERDEQLINIRDRLNGMLSKILLNLSKQYNINYYTKLLLNLLLQTLDTDYTFINITINNEKYVFSIAE